jgi:AraC-like DNA-binding protein
MKKTMLLDTKNKQFELKQENQLLGILMSDFSNVSIADFYIKILKAGLWRLSPASKSETVGAHNFSLFYCRSGSAKLKCGKEKNDIDIEAGNYAVIDDSEGYTFEVAVDWLEMLSIDFIVGIPQKTENNELNSIFSALRKGRNRKASSSSAFSDSYKMLLYELENMGPFYTDAVNAYLKNLFLIALRSNVASRNLKLSSDIIINSDENTFVSDVDTYLKLNVSKPLSLKDIARRFYLSTRSITRLYKQKTGITIVQRLQEIRLEVAKQELLKMPDKKIKTISFSVGYTKTSYFIKLFKKTYGITPTEYRNQNF